MFEQLEEPKKQEPTDYTGLKIVAILAPVFFIFVYFGKADMGFTVILALGLIMLAVKINWNLRRHVWFWAIIVFILLLHIPLFFIVRWPHGNTPTIVYTKPIGIVDFLLIMGAVGFGKRFFAKGSSSDDEEE
jgi:hypothetical protein